MAQGVRVARVAIKGLYGLYDHEITLKHDERVTILHGPNGVGKSVLLRLIASYFNGQFQEFTHLPFSIFEMDLTDGSSVSITYNDSPKGASTRGALEFRISNGASPISFEMPVTVASDRVATQIERSSPFLSKVGDGLFIDMRSSQRLTSEEVIERYGSNAEISAASVISFDQEPNVAKQMRGKISVQFVETQRLLRIPPDSRFQESYYRGERKLMVATVKAYSEDLIRQIGRTLSKYATESQKRDQTFPQRLIYSQASQLGVEELKDRLQKLDERQTNLNTLGLVDKVSYPVPPSEIDSLDEIKRSVMALYVQDTEEKLEVLSELASRISLLVGSLNGKFRNKTLTVSRDRGLQVTDALKKVVPLDALSSGEQHELVLWYDLLFRVESNSLVLIDEPELSLHVVWQKKFLPELLETAKTVPFDAIVATHSPFIIGDRLDLAVPLDADVDQ